MIKYSIFLCFVIAANAHYWDILKIVEDNIDDSVHPCDDFYRHVCNKKGPFNSTWYMELMNAYNEDIREIAEHYVPKKLMESMEFFDRIARQGFDTSVLIDLGGKYLEKCRTNSTEALLFLQMLESFFGRKQTDPCWGDKCFTNLVWDKNCQHASETLMKGAVNLLLEKIELNKKKMEFVKTIIMNGLSSIWALRHQDEFEKLSEMFSFFKEELMESIKKTPWLINSGTMDAFLNISSQMRLTLPNKEISQTLSDILNYQISYENCVKTYNSLGLLANEFCAIFSLQEQENYELFVVNAWNGHPEVTVLNAVVSLMSNNDSLALKYGSVGAILGHEMGHSVIMSDLSDGFYPYYSKEINPCVQQQFNKSCNVYKEGSCRVGDDQIDENGSDIFGFPFVYERLKQKMGDEIHEKIAESKRGLTHAQAFFHLVFSIGCQRGDVYFFENDDHGTHNIRVNAGVIQIPDFEKVFKCSKDSRMVQSKTKQCHIFGENAPQQ